MFGSHDRFGSFLRSIPSGSLVSYLLESQRPAHFFGRIASLPRAERGYFIYISGQRNRYSWRNLSVTIVLERTQMQAIGNFVPRIK